MSQQHHRSPFGDTTLTKVFVGGLAWETPTAVMRGYFEQFGEILEAVIINDKYTGKSKGYGFVTFSDPTSARRACADPNPVINGRKANCNIASQGRLRPSPPRGMNQVGNSYEGGVTATPQGVSPSYLYPFISPAPAVVYPPYGYTTYPPDYTYHQAMYYNQMYGGSSSAPLYYGYSSQAARGTLGTPPAQGINGPSHLYYPAQTGSSCLPYAPHPSAPSAGDLGNQMWKETEGGAVTAASTNSSA